LARLVELLGREHGRTIMTTQHLATNTASEQGKLWAAASYGSFFFGFPIGIIPLIQRDDAFALHHAKHATAVWLSSIAGVLGLFTLAFVLFFFTFGISNFIFIPIIFLFMLWPMITTIHGVILSLNGDWSEPWGAFGLGDTFFGNLDVNPSQPLSQTQPGFAQPQAPIGQPVNPS
jgi:hypothetical protein